jgi:hypothetical protein
MWLSIRPGITRPASEVDALGAGTGKRHDVTLGADRDEAAVVHSNGRSLRL